MNRMVFGRGKAPEHRRPVVCSDHGGVMVTGVGEPEYGCCDECRRKRGLRASRESNDRHKFVPARRRI